MSSKACGNGGIGSPVMLSRTIVLTSMLSRLRATAVRSNFAAMAASAGTRTFRAAPAYSPAGGVGPVVGRRQFADVVADLLHDRDQDLDVALDDVLRLSHRVLMRAAQVGIFRTQQLLADDARNIASDEVDVGHQAARRGGRRIDLEVIQRPLHHHVADHRGDAQIDRAMDRVAQRLPEVRFRHVASPHGGREPAASLSRHRYTSMPGRRERSNSDSNIGWTTFPLSGSQH